MVAQPSSSRSWRSLSGGIGEAFGDANFRRYSVGSIVSWLSFFVQAVAVAWVAWSLTHSTRWLAAVALLDAVPMGLLAPLGGVVADRHDRFRVLLVCYAFATLQSAALAVLAATGRLTIEWLAALTFVHGVIHAFSVPSQFGLLPRFVERSRLSSAIAVASAYATLGLFVGPALAGFVLLHFGPAAAFASNVVGYLVYFGSAALLREREGYRPPPAPHTTMLRDAHDGLRAITGHPGVAALLGLMVFGDALARAVRQMLPAYADTDLNAGIQGFSTLLAAAGVGATLSALWLAHGGQKRMTSPVILAGSLAFLLATAAVMAARTLWPAALAMVARGFCFEICRTGTLALLQTSVPDRLRGRIMSTQFLLQQVASALGVGLVGLAAEPFGLRLPILFGTALVFIAWAAVMSRRHRVAEAFAAERQDGV